MGIEDQPDWIKELWRDIYPDAPSYPVGPRQQPSMLGSRPNISLRPQLMQPQGGAGEELISFGQNETSLPSFRPDPQQQSPVQFNTQVNPASPIQQPTPPQRLPTGSLPPLSQRPQPRVLNPLPQNPPQVNVGVVPRHIPSGVIGRDTPPTNLWEIIQGLRNRNIERGAQRERDDRMGIGSPIPNPIHMLLRAILNTDISRRRDPGYTTGGGF